MKESQNEVFNYVILYNDMPIHHAPGEEIASIAPQNKNYYNGNNKNRRNRGK